MSEAAPHTVEQIESVRGTEIQLIAVRETLPDRLPEGQAGAACRNAAVHLHGAALALPSRAAHAASNSARSARSGLRRRTSRTAEDSREKLTCVRRRSSVLTISANSSMLRQSRPSRKRVILIFKRTITSRKSR